MNKAIQHEFQTNGIGYEFRSSAKSGASVRLHFVNEQEMKLLSNNRPFELAALIHASWCNVR